MVNEVLDDVRVAVPPPIGAHAIKRQQRLVSSDETTVSRSSVCRQSGHRFIVCPRRLLVVLHSSVAFTHENDLRNQKCTNATTATGSASWGRGVGLILGKESSRHAVIAKEYRL